MTTTDQRTPDTSAAPPASSPDPGPVAEPEDPTGTTDAPAGATDESPDDAPADAPVIETVRTDDDDEPCAEHPLSTRVEVLLLSTDRPLTEARLGALLGLVPKGAAKRVRDAIEEVNEACAATGRPWRVEKLAGGWQVLTLPEYGPLLSRLHRDRQQSRLTPPALETLAIIAYRTRGGVGILRAEIEAIRGVSCGEVLRGLLERRLVKIVGRAEELGRPMLYGVTREFLKVFGLSSLDDLPAVAGMDEPATRPKPAPKPAAESNAESNAAIADDSDTAPPAVADDAGAAPDDGDAPPTDDDPDQPPAGA